jgi:hypothetical protein
MDRRRKKAGPWPRSRSGDGEGPGVLGGLHLEAIADDAAQPGDAGVGDAVVGGRTLAPAGDDAGGVEDAEVLADVGLAAVERVADLADVELVAFEEEIQDGEAGGVAEDAEAFGDVLDKGGREKVIRHDGHCITVQR